MTDRAMLALQQEIAAARDVGVRQAAALVRRSPRLRPETAAALAAEIEKLAGTKPAAPEGDLRHGRRS